MGGYDADSGETLLLLTESKSLVDWLVEVVHREELTPEGSFNAKSKFWQTQLRAGYDTMATVRGMWRYLTSWLAGYYRHALLARDSL